MIVNYCHRSIYVLESNSIHGDRVSALLQVELFKKANQTEFSIAYDCEPYFSAASWMGILTLSILLPILIVGFFLVFQTQTMDRFDDPREPPLATTVLE